VFYLTFVPSIALLFHEETYEGLKREGCIHQR